MLLVLIFGKKKVKLALLLCPRMGLQTQAQAPDVPHGKPLCACGQLLVPCKLLTLLTKTTVAVLWSCQEGILRALKKFPSLSKNQSCPLRETVGQEGGEQGTGPDSSSCRMLTQLPGHHHSSLLRLVWPLKAAQV